MGKRLKSLARRLLITYCGFRGLIFCFFTFVPVVLFYVVGLYHCWRVLSDFGEDTTTITSAAFGIMAAFSSLSFRWSSTVEDSKEDKERLAYCGERFLHAALLLVLSSVIKYAVIEIGPVPFDSVTQLSQITWRFCVTIIFGGMVPILFFWALTFAHTGVIFINRILWIRLKKYKYWDSWA